MLLQTLQYVGAILTALVGALSVFAPEKAANFTGLISQGGRGRTEIRAVFGGVFLALGILPFFMGDAAFMLLGISYLMIGAIRLMSIFLDRSGNTSNWASLAFELIFGAILVL